LTEANHRIVNHVAILACHVRLKTATLARKPTEPCRSEMRLLLEGIGVRLGVTMIEMSGRCQVSRVRRLPSAKKVRVDSAGGLPYIPVPFCSPPFRVGDRRTLAEQGYGRLAQW
jgi:hypothetical protein